MCNATVTEAVVKQYLLSDSSSKLHRILVNTQTLSLNQNETFKKYLQYVQPELYMVLKTLVKMQELLMFNICVLDIHV